MKQAARYVSTIEAARILECSPDNVRVLVRGGRLPVAIETSAGRLLRRADVERMAAARQAKGAKAPQ